MAACGSLQHMFEKTPLPETPALLDSLSSWNQIKPVKPLDQPSFTEIFGELHFKDASHSPSPSSSSSSSSPSFIDLSTPQTVPPNVNKSDSDSLNNEYKNKKSPSIFDTCSGNPQKQYTVSHKSNSDGFSPKSYESWQLCTEGLGFESSDEVEDMKNDIEKDWQYHEEKVSITKHSSAQENLNGEFRRSRSSGGEFPPPISCIGKSGKPWVCFKSYREDGRFVLKEVRVPTLEFLHACREDGRLKLHFIHSNEEMLDEGEEDEEGEEENYTEEDEREENEDNSSKDDNDDGNDGGKDG